MPRAHTRRRFAAAAAIVIVAAAACTTDKTAAPPGGTTATAKRAPATAPPGPIAFAGDLHVTVANAGRCELYSPECLLPFPSDRFTRPDAATDTGRRVHLDLASMPANTAGVHVDPAEWNRNDGFSPGALIIAKVDGVDLGRSGAPPVTDIGASLRPDSPIVLLDADTGERHPFFSELDANEHGGGVASDRRALLIRPAVNLTEGHRYVVALRNLVDASGTAIDPPPAFRALRDRLRTKEPAIEDRRRSVEDLFAVLGDAGVRRQDLHLAWDFTVASQRSLSERVLHMRDDAFAQIGRDAPTVRITKVQEQSEGPVLRRVEAKLTVPNYLTGGGAPGSRLNNAADPDGVPMRDGTLEADVVCVVPRTATESPAQMVIYGHGLLGTRAEGQRVGELLAGVRNVVTCATDWIGMSTIDVVPVAQTLNDLSGFRIIPDRLQQAMVNVLFLGRALKHPQGMRGDAAFRTASGAAVLGDDLVYVGNSQGGILGGATSSLAQDWTRAFLGVPAQNYSTLLNRSVDFDEYAVLLRTSYPDPIAQQLLFSLIQMLWDRGENNGYAAHLTSDPYRDTPAKQVMIFAAFGDHQVANVGTDMLARTIGAKIRQPALEPGRSTDVVPFWGIEAVPSLPYTGGAVYVMWDFGTPAPPVTNTPNRAGKDPHGQGRDSPDVLRMAWTFLGEGTLVDVCDGKLCRTPPR